jgi:UDP-N-acetylglucosamine acyltransferase
VARIDASARIADGARLGADVEVGPFCVIGPKAVIGDGCRLIANVFVTGRSEIGARTVIHPYASLGTPPQSIHYKGEDTRLVVGADCDIREHATMNIGTAGGRGETRIGHHGFFMVGAHVAHDCIVGNHVTFANNATLGGHVEIGDHVFIGGLSGVHQHVRVGEHAMIGGAIGLRQDVIPFGVIDNDGRLRGLNLVGLKRRGFSRDAIHALRAAYRMLFFGEGSPSERVEQMAQAFPEDTNVQRMAEFVRAAGKRRLVKPRELADDD